MKRALVTLLAVGLIAGIVGCCNAPVNGAAQTCDPRTGCLGLGAGGADSFVPGPPTGAITYPYYTLRGPRDFLASDPRTIGP
jgi:hypothetical protein